MPKLTSFKFLFLFLFLGCKQKSKMPVDYQFANFQLEKSLEADVVAVNGLDMPSKVCVIPKKNLLIILEMRGFYLAKVYSLDSLKFLKSFIEVGASETKQLSAHTIQFIDRGNLLYISDAIKNKLFVYSVDSIISSAADILPMRVISGSSKNLFFPVIVDDGKIVDLVAHTKDSTTQVLNFYNKDSKFVYSSIGELPKTSQDFHFTQIDKAFTGALGVAKNTSNIALSYYFTDYLDIYNAKGELLKRVHGPEGFDPEIETKSAMGGKVNFIKKSGHYTFTGAPVFGDSEIFTLYDGAQSSSRTKYTVNRLLSFDLDLKPKVCYTLDNPIFYFDIDWSTRTLYGLTHDIKNSIIKYKF